MGGGLRCRRVSEAPKHQQRKGAAQSLVWGRREAFWLFGALLLASAQRLLPGPGSLAASEEFPNKNTHGESGLLEGTWGVGACSPGLTVHSTQFA